MQGRASWTGHWSVLACDTARKTVEARATPVQLVVHNEFRDDPVVVRVKRVHDYEKVPRYGLVC